MVTYGTTERVNWSRFLLCCCFSVLFLSLVFVNLANAEWKQKSPCSDPQAGWAGSSSDHISSEISLKIVVHAKYKFIGDISWDNRIGSTHGEISIAKKGSDNWQKVDGWDNPPPRATFEKDITQYIKEDGNYIVRWKYTKGKSGICIHDTNIVVAE